jgi:hypothetical protein
MCVYLSFSVEMKKVKKVKKRRVLHQILYGKVPQIFNDIVMDDGRDEMGFVGLFGVWYGWRRCHQIVIVEVGARSDF